MSVVHVTAVRNTVSDAVTTLLNGGTLEILAGATVLASLALSATAAASASGGVATFNTITSATASNTGTADGFKLKNSSGTEQLSGSVTTTGGGGDIELDTTAVTGGSDTVAISSLTYTAPA